MEKKEEDQRGDGEKEEEETKMKEGEIRGGKGLRREKRKGKREITMAKKIQTKE